MDAIKPKVATNLIMGFLGVGKTTAILSLLQQKPPEQNWAVLVNEFGQVGIDGGIYASHNATVRELPGGCLCCTQGLPFDVAVKRLLRETKPDRLLIEPTGLGHPKRLIDKLTGGYFQPVLDMRASLCLIDPRKLKESRYTENENFVDQIVLSDVLIANKMDLADHASIDLFRQWSRRSRPGKVLTAETSRGRLAVEWLDLPRQPARFALFPEAHSRSSRTVGFAQGYFPFDQDYQSAGKIFPEHACFDFKKLCEVLDTHPVARVKGIVLTGQGWYIVNGVDGLVEYLKIDSGSNSRIECLGRPEQSDKLLQAVHSSLRTGE